MFPGVSTSPRAGENEKEWRNKLSQNEDQTQIEILSFLFLLHKKLKFAFILS